MKKAKIIQQGNFTVAIVEETVSGVTRTAVGISKYNPLDSKLKKDKQGNIILKDGNPVPIMPFSYSRGADIAKGRALKRLETGRTEDTIIMETAMADK